MKTILVPVDFSDVTSALIESAKTFARAFGSHIILINVMPVPNMAISGSELSEPFVREVRGDYESLNELNEALLSAGVKVSLEQHEGDPVGLILKQARDHKVDMIIMGSHGHGAIYNLLVGSVTQGVLKSANIPVLVIPSQITA